MINLSKHKLGSAENSVLEKGLNFIPTPKDITIEPIKEATTKFSRRLKLAYRFRRSNNHFKEKFVAPSTFTPEDSQMPAEVLETIQKINDDISQIQTPYLKKNLQKCEFEALKKLRDNPEIIIKSADKGSATVIMDKMSYINEGYRQLNDERYYKKIDEPIYPETAKKVNDILCDLLEKKFISVKQFNYLKAPQLPKSTDIDVSRIRPRQFYLLPKVHKPIEKWPLSNQPPGRPIISDCSSESYHVAEYIDSFLQPLAAKHDSYLKDTSDFLNKLKQVKVNETSLIVTMDVESMYTNIDHDSGLAAVRRAFERNPDSLRPDEQILQLLELSLKNNDFQFNGETYLQTKGTAMGKKFAPSYANIFMADFETEAMKKCYQKPTVYWRFLDDIFNVWDHGRENLNTFLDVLNSHHPNVKLTANIEELSNDFLDVTIFKGPQFHSKEKFDTKVYFKPTDTHQLLHKASFHPKHTFGGILKSQIMRFYRICSQKSDFDAACSLLFKALKGRGYSERTLRFIKSQTLKSILSGALIKPPVLGPEPEPEAEYSVEKCDSGDCLTCSSVIECYELASNTTKFVYKIRQNLNCKSQNLVYMIYCCECEKQYIGETKRTLRRRAYEHKRDIEHFETRNTTVSRHFNTRSCDGGDFRIIPLFQCPELETEVETTRLRREIEQFFIAAFKTYLPYGLNIAVKRYKDTLPIHFSVPYSGLAKLASNVVKSHYKDLQAQMPEIFPFEVVSAYSRNRNLKDMLVSAKIKN